MLYILIIMYDVYTTINDILEQYGSLYKEFNAASNTLTVTAL